MHRMLTTYMCRPYVYGSGQYIMKQGHSSMVPLTRGHPPYPASLSSLNGWPYKRGSTLQLRILCPPPPPRHSYLGPPVPFRSGVLVTRKLLLLAVVSASQCQASRCITTTALIKNNPIHQLPSSDFRALLSVFA